MNSKQGQTQLESVRFLLPSIVSDVLYRWMDIVLAIIVAMMAMYIYLTVSWVPQYSMEACYAVMSKATTGYETYSTGSVSYTVTTTVEYLIESEILEDSVAEELGVDVLNGTISTYTLENTNYIYLTVTADSPRETYQIMTAVLVCYEDLADVVLGSVTLDVVEQPSIPTSPSNTPNRSRMMFLAGVGALIFMIAILVLFSCLRETVKTEEDFRKKLGIRRLATIPKEKTRLWYRLRRNKNEDLLITKFPISYRFTEGIEKFRSNFEYRARKKDCKVVLVTSTLPNEGKSTVSVNLALSLAKAGKRVILVDGDLRNPTIYGLLHMEKQIHGELGDFLQGKCELNEVLGSYGRLKKFYVVSGEKRYENASELLGSSRMSSMVKTLRQITDYIIIDTPPAGAMIDTEEVSDYADGAVLVVRQNAAPVKAVQDVIDSLEQTGIHVLGCVFNHVRVIGDANKGSYARGLAGSHHGGSREVKD